MKNSSSTERVADWAAGYAAGFAAGCDSSELGRLYQRALRERDAAERAAQALDRRLKTLQGRITAPPRRGRIANDSGRPPPASTPSPPPTCCASDPGGALFEES